jgi:hypothetical protein
METNQVAGFTGNPPYPIRPYSSPIHRSTSGRCGRGEALIAGMVMA